MDLRAYFVTTTDWKGYLDRIGIYAALGVPEIWRWVAKGSGQLVCLVMTQPGLYEESPTSRALPTVPLEALAEQVRKGLSRTHIQALREFRVWVRRELRQG